MALHWELDGIENWKETCVAEDGKMRGETECLIWATMFVGLGKIADPVAFWTRLTAWEAIMGPISSSGEPLSFDLVNAHRGLVTNVSNETEAQFWKRLREGNERRCKDRIAAQAYTRTERELEAERA